MEYLTTCYRQQGESGCSLLLQQYLCRQMPVCFACLCTEEGEGGRVRCRYAAESLLNWSRKVPWHKAARRPGRWLERLEGELINLTEEQARGAASREERKMTLLIGIGEEILVLGSGQNIILLSTSFGRGKSVRQQEQFRGYLEPGAGLLLATDGFLKNIAGESLEEALRIQEIRTEEQADRRLREIAALREPSAPREFASPWDIAIPREPAAIRGNLASREPALPWGQRRKPENSGGSKIPGGEPVAAILLLGR